MAVHEACLGLTMQPSWGWERYSSWLPLAHSLGEGALLPVTTMSGGKQAGELTSSGRQIEDTAALATHPPQRW